MTTKKRKDGSIFVANELYTESEAKKYNIPTNYYESINIPKNQVYFFFGARFAN